ncbi:MAG: ABC transporter substrate-binding protein [Proteobacteria bacterium]|nr:ABC transporter substrate-binding protein [Pseudomonadota bacterium]
MMSSASFRTVLASALILAGGVLSTSAAWADNKAIVLSSQPNEAGFPMWLANKLGYYSDRGLAVKIQYFPNGGAALASGAAGDWQAGWTGSPPAITGWAKFGLTTVGTMMKEDRNIKLVMRKEALKGSSPADVLKTKPVGTVPNSTWSQVLFACAKHFNVEPGQMKIVPLDPPVTRQALQSGDVGSGTTDSSPDFDIVNDTEKFQVVCDGAIAKTSVIDPYIVTKKFAAEQPDTAARFVEASYRANEFIMANKDQALKYLLEYYKDVGIDGSEAKARYTLGLRDYQTLNQALSDMSDGTTAKTLTETGKVFVAGGAYDKVPDMDADIKAGLPILKAAAALRK